MASRLYSVGTALATCERIERFGLKRLPGSRPAKRRPAQVAIDIGHIAADAGCHSCVARVMRPAANPLPAAQGQYRTAQEMTLCPRGFSAQEQRVEARDLDPQVRQSGRRKVVDFGDSSVAPYSGRFAAKVFRSRSSSITDGPNDPPVHRYKVVCRSTTA